MQKAWLISKRSQAGFSAVEALLAATVFAFLVSGIIGAIIYGRASTADAGTHNRAAHLAEEGIEATRNIANASYSNLVNGTYGLAQSGGVWTLSGTSDSSDIYTRQVTIADAGTDRKMITSIVSWTQPGGSTSSITLTSRISNWEAAIIQPASWANGILAGSVDLSGTVDALKIATSGNYAYIIRGSGTNNFTVINISNPAAPTVVGNLTLAGTPANIDINGNYAYIANGGDTTELQVVNISNPAAPTLAATRDLTGTANATGIYINGTTAFITRATSTTTGSNELATVNIATPTNPTVIGGYNNNITMNEVYVFGNYAYVATASTSAELLIVNITNLTTPTLAGTYNPSGLAGATSVAGFGTTILIGYGTVMDSVNATTPSTPVRLGTYSTGSGGNITDIDIDSGNQYAFVSNAYMFGELQVINISNPASMSATKLFDTSGSPGTVNGVAYNASLDLAVGASTVNTQELMVFTKN